MELRTSVVLYLVLLMFHSRCLYSPSYSSLTPSDTCLKLFTNCICAIVITALLYDRVHRSFRKSEVGSRKSEVGRPFSAFIGTRLHDGLISQGHIWFWSNQRRSYHLNCKIKLQSRSLFSVLRLFRMLFLVWVWDILIREFEKKRKTRSIGGAFGFVVSVSWRKMPLL